MYVHVVAWPLLHVLESKRTLVWLITKSLHLDSDRVMMMMMMMIFMCVLDKLYFSLQLVGAVDVASARGDAMCADAIKTLKVDFSLTVYHTVNYAQLTN